MIVCIYEERSESCVVSAKIALKDNNCFVLLSIKNEMKLNLYLPELYEVVFTNRK